MQDDGVAPTIATRQLPRSGFVQIQIAVGADSLLVDEHAVSIRG